MDKRGGSQWRHADDADMVELRASMEAEFF